MRARSPVRALAWKEARELWLIVLGALISLLLLALIMEGGRPEIWSYILVVFVAPGCAAIMGGISVAGENASGARHFLFARAIGERTILAVKVGAHALAAAILSGTALALGRVVEMGVDGWSTPLQTTTDRAWILGLVLVPAMFLVGLACSLVLPDALNAAPAAIVAGGMLSAAIIMPAVWLAGAMDTAFEGLPFLLAALVAAAIFVLLLAARRAGFVTRGWLASGRGRASLVALGAVLGGCWVHALTREPAQARLILAGSASVVGSDIVAEPRGSAVAFVASPESGRARTVISLIDERRLVTLSVLAPGTRPLGWSQSLGAFLVEWPDGARRIVSSTGDIHPSPGLPSDLAAERGAFDARGGRLVRDVNGEEVIAFPREEGR